MTWNIDCVISRIYSTSASKEFKFFSFGIYCMLINLVGDCLQFWSERFCINNVKAIRYTRVVNICDDISKSSVIIENFLSVLENIVNARCD